MKWFGRVFLARDHAKGELNSVKLAVRMQW